MTIFKKIIDKEIPAEIVYEDDLCLAFKDISPAAPVHLLLIPKKEIPTLDDLAQTDQELISHMVLQIPKIAHENNLQKGYKVKVNVNEAGGQEVYHLHFHILGSPNANIS